MFLDLEQEPKTRQNMSISREKLKVLHYGDISRISHLYTKRHNGRKRVSERYIRMIVLGERRVLSTVAREVNEIAEQYIDSMYATYLQLECLN